MQRPSSCVFAVFLSSDSLHLRRIVRLALKMKDPWERKKGGKLKSIKISFQLAKDRTEQFCKRQNRAVLFVILYHLSVNERGDFHLP